MAIPIFDPINFLQNLGMAEILLWLLSFAIVNGLLSMANLPGSKGARGLISLVIAFFILLSTPTEVLAILYNMSSGFVLTILVILLLLIFFEVAGIKGKHLVFKKNEKGEEVPVGFNEVPIFERYGALFAAAFGIIAILIFMSSGGLTLLGFENIQLNFSDQGLITIGFFILVIIGVVWMIANPDK